MKKIILIVCATLLTLGAQAQKTDGKNVVRNGNNCFALSLFGGVQYNGGNDYMKDFSALAGGEIIYNYKALRLGIGGAWGEDRTDYINANIGWNMVQNLNRANQFYLSAGFGMGQYNYHIARKSELIITHPNLKLEDINIHKMGIRKWGPQATIRVGADWRLSKKCNLYLTTFVEGYCNINADSQITTIPHDHTLEIEGGKGEISTGDIPLTCTPTKFGARACLGLSIRL